MKHIVGSVVVSLALAGSAASASVLTQYNLIVAGNLDSNQEVEGRTFVGGNLSGPASNYGTMLTPPAAFLGTDVLQVAGNITAGNINMQAGNLRRAGSRSGNLNLNGGGSEIIDPSLVSLASSITLELNSTSTILGALTPDSSVSFPSGQPGAATFNATPGADGLAVFNVTAAAVTSGLIQQYDLNVNGASAIVINVTGASASFNAGNFVGNWTSQFARANVIWNFIDATSISIDRQFFGAVLAPGATLTNSTSIEGSVFVGAFIQRGEVHLPSYTGFVPAPGAIVLAAVALAPVARRRRAA